MSTLSLKLEGVTIEPTSNANAWVFLPQWPPLFAQCHMVIPFWIAGLYLVSSTQQLEDTYLGGDNQDGES